MSLQIETLQRRRFEILRDLEGEPTEERRQQLTREFYDIESELDEAGASE